MTLEQFQGLYDEGPYRMLEWADKALEAYMHGPNYAAITQPDLLAQLERQKQGIRELYGLVEPPESMQVMT